MRIYINRPQIHECRNWNQATQFHFLQYMFRILGSMSAVGVCYNDTKRVLYSLLTLFLEVSPSALPYQRTGLKGGVPTHTRTRGSNYTVSFVISSIGPLNEKPLAAQTAAFSPCRQEVAEKLKCCIHYTVKKGLRFSRPQPGCHLSNYPWSGMIVL